MKIKLNVIFTDQLDKDQKLTYWGERYSFVARGNRLPTFMKGSLSISVVQTPCLMIQQSSRNLPYKQTDTCSQICMRTRLFTATLFEIVNG